MSQLFSICIPTYNSRRFACETVRSALDQTYPNVEVIVDDNSSSDGTQELLLNQFRNHPRFQLKANREDLDIPNGWNRAVGWAQGDYVLLLHSDNLLHPQYCSKIVAAMQAYHSPVAFSETLYFDGETPKGLFAEPGKEAQVDLFGGGPRTIGHLFQYERMIPISSVTFLRELFKNEKPFDPNYRWDPDMELLLRVGLRERILFFHDPLVAMRSHPDQAPNWRDPSFSTQYRSLLKMQHLHGRTETLHFLQQCARSNEDICQRISRLEVPFKVYLKYQFKWWGSELALFGYSAKHFLRKLRTSLHAWATWFASKPLR